MLKKNVFIIGKTHKTSFRRKLSLFIRITIFVFLSEKKYIPSIKKLNIIVCLFKYVLLIS